MKSIIVMALILGFTVHALDAKAISHKSQEISAKSKSKGKSEPAPKEDDRKGGGDETDPRQGTFEGNDRGEGGGSFDGGGYSGGGDDGGFIGEIFSAADNRTYPTRTTSSVEDRGEVLVYTTQIQEDISASETCVTTIVSVVDKASGKSLKTDSDRFCNVIGY
jgi:hypothetical protein